MVKLAETIIKSTKQLFFIPPVMLFVAPDGKCKSWYKFSGAMKHNGHWYGNVKLRV